MGNPKLMKRRRKKTVTSIKSLPNDMVAEVLSRVASSSLTDLFSANISCKTFHGVAGDSYVLQHVSVDFLWIKNSKVAYFFEHCKKVGNPGPLYMHGMDEYFNLRKMELGQHLRKVRELGNMEATHMMGMILFSDESTELQGIELLNRVESFGLQKKRLMEECRQRCKKTLSRLWLNTTLPQKVSRCSNAGCRNNGRKGTLRKGESIWDERNSMEDDFCRQRCKWVIELNRLCCLFPQNVNS